MRMASHTEAPPAPATEIETERDLVARLRQGDPAAFDRAYALHRDPIHRFLLRLAGRRDLADDLFQETFLKLARHALRLAEDTHLAAWLFTVARNEYRSYRRFLLLDDDRLRALHLLPAARTAPSPEADTACGQAMAQLERALAEVSPKSREVLLLVGVEQLSQDVVAAILGLQPAALRKRLERARADLTARLTKIQNGDPR